MAARTREDEFAGTEEAACVSGHTGAVGRVSRLASRGPSSATLALTHTGQAPAFKAPTRRGFCSPEPTRALAAATQHNALSGAGLWCLSATSSSATGADGAQRGALPVAQPAAPRLSYSQVHA